MLGQTYLLIMHTQKDHSSYVMPTEMQVKRQIKLQSYFKPTELRKRDEHMCSDRSVGKIITFQCVPCNILGSIF